MFHFPDEVDWKWFFRFDKRWIENMNWASISAAAKSVLPVIACHCNERGAAFPAEETISGLSGRTEKTVRQGISDLKGFPGFDWEPYKTKREKQSKKFHLELPPKRERGRSIFFYRVIMDGGLWSKLKPTAQALYPAMRYSAIYVNGQDEYSTEEGEFMDGYIKRKFEICDAEVGLLAHLAGIDRRSVKDAMQSLQANFLLEPYDDSGWATDGTPRKVFILPAKIYLPSYLNQNLQKAAAR
jgi:hypothetical protein